MKAARNLLHSPERDCAIAQNFLQSPYMERESFFIYLAAGSEAGTQAIIKELLARNKRVLLPRVVGNTMYAVPYSENTELKWGIPQPVEGEDTPAEVALAPLLAVDEGGVRLGYGGGYYDRYFASHPGTLRVGLAYGGQAVKHLPCAPHDIALHALITEEGVRYFT